MFMATDIHGSERCFRKFVNAGKFYKANVLIMGGDLTGKMLVPMVECPDGSVRATLFGRERVATGRREIEELMYVIRSAGFYPYPTKPEEIEHLDPSKVEKLFSELAVRTLRRWIDLAEERLKGTGASCYLQPGNDDILDIDAVLEDSKYVVNPEGKVIEIAPHYEMISTGYANMTPWNCPRDISEDELARRIEDMARRVKSVENCIFNFHCPPFGSQLDLAPELDQNLNVVMRSGRVSMVPVGSKAVREAIERYQPIFGLHGHIHESRGTCRIGRTLCLNPGSEYTEGILRGALLELDNRGLKSYQLTSG